MRAFIFSVAQQTGMRSLAQLICLALIIPDNKQEVVLLTVYKLPCRSLNLTQWLNYIAYCIGPGHGDGHETINKWSIFQLCGIKMCCTVNFIYKMHQIECQILLKVV